MTMQLGSTRFRDRAEAGRRLAGALTDYADGDGVVVLALPRGGVPVGFEVARSLVAPLDVLVVRKLGVPGHEELAMGALASGGVRVLDQELTRSLGVEEEEIAAVAAEEQRHLEAQERLFRAGRTAPQIDRRTAILVDDGLATGSTMRAAAHAIRARRPATVVVAVPVAPAETCRLMEQVADEVVCPATPERFRAVGDWYEEFPQTTDEEVIALLERADAELVR